MKKIVLILFLFFSTQLFAQDIGIYKYKNILSYVNKNNTKGINILLIHGIAHNSNVFKPLMDFITTKYQNNIYAVFAIDLPGHGDGSLCDTNAYKIGDLRLKHYVDAILKALKFIGRVDIIVGHSMSGLLIQMIEQKLNKENSSLKKKFLVQGILLIAPSFPEQVDWGFARFGNPLWQTLSSIKLFDDYNGMHANFSNDEFRKLFFSSVPRDILEDSNINEIKDYESLRVMFQLVGKNIFYWNRPILDENIFNSYELVTISYENDRLTKENELRNLHTFLGGIEQNFFHVFGDRAVHDGFYLDPKALAPALDCLVMP